MTELADMLEQHSWLRPFVNLGYESIDQVMSSAAVAGPEITRMIPGDAAALLAAVSGLSTISAEESRVLASLPCPIGALEPEPRSFGVLTAEIAEATAASAATVNLIGSLPPIRNQGLRGTCVAHAVLAAYEQMMTMLGGYQDMSEQFLYWNCKANDGKPQGEGTFVSLAAKLLARDGCCLESTWPYVTTKIIGNEGQEPAPAGASRLALSFRPSRSIELPAKSVTDLKNALARNAAVAFSVPVFNTWYQSDAVRRDGNIVNPASGELPVGGHAMCLVGYEDLPARPELGGGRFILRNSWGSGWGATSTYGAGYGTIPYVFLQRFCMEAFCLA